MREERPPPHKIFLLSLGFLFVSSSLLCVSFSFYVVQFSFPTPSNDRVVVLLCCWLFSAANKGSTLTRSSNPLHGYLPHTERQHAHPRPTGCKLMDRPSQFFFLVFTTFTGTRSPSRGNVLSYYFFLQEAHPTDVSCTNKMRLFRPENFCRSLESILNPTVLGKTSKLRFSKKQRLFDDHPVCHSSSVRPVCFLKSAKQ
jgi:hypothetical protein